MRVIFREPERTTFTIGEIESFREAGRRSHIATETIVLELAHTTSTPEIARATGFDEGIDLTFVERVRRIDGVRLIRDRNLFRSSSVPDLTREIASRSVYEYIEGTLGLRIAMSKRTITGERANARDREVLDLDGVDYLAVVTSQTFDTQGILIECTESRHRLDHFCFRDTAVRQKV